MVAEERAAVEVGDGTVSSGGMASEPVSGTGEDSGGGGQ